MKYLKYEDLDDTKMCNKVIQIIESNKTYISNSSIDNNCDNITPITNNIIEEEILKI